MKTQMRKCVYGSNKISCKIELKRIQSLNNKFNIINCVHFEAILSQVMFLSGIYNFAYCVFREGVTYVMTSTLTDSCL